MTRAGQDNRYKPVRAWMVNRGEIDPELICRTREQAGGFDQLEDGPVPVIIADARHFKVVPMVKCWACGKRIEKSTGNYCHGCGHYVCTDCGTTTERWGHFGDKPGSHGRRPK